MRALKPAAVAAAVILLSACAGGAKWTEYSYPAWGFAVSMPVAPKVTDSPASADPHGVRVFKVIGNQATASFGAVVLDASATDKSNDQILSELPRALAEGGTLTSTTYTATGKVLGRELRIDRAGQPTLAMRIFVADKKVYEIGAQSPLGPTAPDVTRFLDSFRLLAK